MIQIYEIPLLRGPQKFPIEIRGTVYNLKLHFRPDPGPGWIFDIFDREDNPLLCGNPLLPGTDLLAQHPYLNMGVALFVTSDVDPDQDLTFEAIGNTAHLYYAFDDGGT